MISHNHRYCIIDQVKLPHYQHAYDNVDRDEDDEIDIAELDFALKAVNYDLISDAEMTYVHSVITILLMVPLVNYNNNYYFVINS